MTKHEEREPRPAWTKGPSCYSCNDTGREQFEDVEHSERCAICDDVAEASIGQSPEQERGGKL